MFFDFLEIIICVLWRGEYVLESKMEIGELWLLEMSARLVQTSMHFQFDSRACLDYRNMYTSSQGFSC